MSQTLERRKYIENENVLLDILHELAIDPFTKESVNKYKQEKLKPYWIRIKLQQLTKRFQTVLEYTTILGGACLLASTLILVSATLLCSFQFMNANDVVAASKTFVTCLLSMTGYMGILYALSHISYPEWLYQRYYNDTDVPCFVNQTAEDIYEKMVERGENPHLCHYKIDAFYMTKILDPFLVVTYDNKDYYIEVWNESYQKEREI